MGGYQGVDYSTTMIKRREGIQLSVDFALSRTQRVCNWNQFRTFHQVTLLYRLYFFTLNYLKYAIGFVVEKEDERQGGLLR